MFVQKEKAMTWLDHDTHKSTKMIRHGRPSRPNRSPALLLRTPRPRCLRLLRSPRPRCCSARLARPARSMRPTPSSTSPIAEEETGEAYACTPIHLTPSTRREAYTTAVSYQVGRDRRRRCVSGIFGYVASLYFKCFSCFRRMFQVFHLDVVYVAMAIHHVSSVYFRCFQTFLRRKKNYII
jgi:hypothetical protein